jgi:4-oxalocrotonate tautomerase family enzyme
VPLISIRLVAGRSEEQLAELVEGVSVAAADALALPVERIGVHIFELPPARIARGGRLLADGSSGRGADGP